LIEIRLRLAISDARERRSFGWQARCELLGLLYEATIKLRPHARCNGGAVSLKIGVVNLHVRRWRGPWILLFGERVTAEAHDLQRSNQAPSTRSGNGVCRRWIPLAELLVERFAPNIRELQLKLFANQGVAWPSATREEALQQAALVEAGTANHDGDPHSPAPLGVTSDGGACCVKPVIQRECVARLSNINACMRANGTNFGADLVGADVKATKYLA
jgi:hypothetical protein